MPLQLSLLVAEGYSALREVVGRHFDSHLVAGQNFYVVHTHFAGDVGCEFVAVFKFDAKHRVAECFDDYSVLFDCCLFCHLDWLGKKALWLVVIR